jgi:hypothetical protein
MCVILCKIGDFIVLPIACPVFSVLKNHLLIKVPWRYTMAQENNVEIGAIWIKK